jgi:hypothetical protein
MWDQTLLLIEQMGRDFSAQAEDSNLHKLATRGAEQRADDGGWVGTSDVSMEVRLTAQRRHFGAAGILTSAEPQ